MLTLRIKGLISLTVGTSVLDQVLRDKEFRRIGPLLPVNTHDLSAYITKHTEHKKT